MADTTKTSGPAYSSLVMPKRLESGMNVLSKMLNLNAAYSLSASDVFPFFKIPHGAVIHDIKGYGFYAADSAILKLGFAAAPVTGVSDDFFLTTFTLSNTGSTLAVLRTGSVPYHVSLTDNETQRWVSLQVKVASVSTSTNVGRFGFTVMYSMDNGQLTYTP